MQRKRPYCGMAPVKRFGDNVRNLTYARLPCNYCLSGTCQYTQITYSARIKQAFVVYFYFLGVSYSTDCTGTYSQWLRYSKLINHSLYLVNILPVPALNGFHFLAALLNLVFHQTTRQCRFRGSRYQCQAWCTPSENYPGDYDYEHHCFDCTMCTV